MNNYHSNQFLQYEEWLKVINKRNLDTGKSNKDKDRKDKTVSSEKLKKDDRKNLRATSEMWFG